MFDRELKQIRSAALDGTDSARFEIAVANLLFLHGFAPAPQLETDAPDIIALTPAGTVVLVECTVRVADFQTKVGKLLDRQRALAAAFQAAGQSTRVVAVLVSAQSRTQIAADERFLAQHDITLVCRETLVRAFELVHFPRNPDDLLEDARRARAAMLSTLAA